MDNNIIVDNYKPAELKRVFDDTQIIISEINDAVNWVDSSLQLIDKTTDNDKKYDTTYILKTSRRKLKKIKNAVLQKPAVAFFGASQVGKSYLVNNIFFDEDNKFFLYDNTNKKYDFIAQINPEGGGKESTSVVTRFNHNEKINEKISPVSIKILSIKDLITIIADGYLADVEIKDLEYTKEVVEKYIKDVKQYVGSKNQNHLTEDDVYDIKDYLFQFYIHKNKEIFKALDDSNFWRFVGTNIKNIKIDDFSNVFSILWGKNNELTKLFSGLLEELKRLEYSEVVYADFDSVLRDKGAILDVLTLNKYYSNTNNEVRINLKVNNSEVKEISINNSKLCAISKEVIFNISKTDIKPKRLKLVKNTDILDFPGSRSRKELDERKLNEKKEFTLELLLRAKVAYLFNSYTVDYKINSLLANHNHLQKNVENIQGLINGWINYTIGENPDTRAKTLKNYKTPPLFIIFTYWNKQLDFDRDNDIEFNNDTKEEKIKAELDYKWEHRFKEVVKSEVFGSYEWWEKWLPGSKFQNYYLIRGIKYSTDIFHGFDINRKELRLNDNRKQYYEKLKKSFINSSLVKQFFKEPENVWEETSTVGKDGTELVIDNLLQIATNKIKTERFKYIIEEAKENILYILEEIFVDKDLKNSTNDALTNAGEIISSIDVVFRKNILFGKFIEKLHVSSDEIFNLYHNKLKNHILVEEQEFTDYYLVKSRCPEISNEKSFNENVEILKEEYKLINYTIDEVIQHFKDKLKVDLKILFDLNKKQIIKYSENLANSAVEHWIKNKLKIENFDFLVSQGFKKEYLIQLLTNLKNVAQKKINISKEIALKIGPWVDSVQGVIYKAKDMIAAVTTETINDFINFYGWNNYKEEEKKYFRDVNRDKNLELIFPDDNKIFEKEDDEELTEIFNFINDYENQMNSVKYLGTPLKQYGGKIDADKKTKIINNTPFLRNLYLWTELMKIGFIATSDIADFDEEANKKLGVIIDKIKEINISI